ncbi:hypothetical protein [Novosphingobium sp. M1R2S20]|uniref:Uncharacterized protein n=1 Tax=Novosphingobium rhizovicinum TaxID=3228928 RepID=A0ABV3RES7_9SPHN
MSWNREWPMKPDVVLECGNIGHDPATGNGDHVDDLALLTIYRRTVGQRAAFKVDCAALE